MDGKLPQVLISYAQSLDGRIAVASGESQWISGSETLTLAHELRKAYDAILVGIGTVLRDNPELSCRIPDCQSPTRVILDADLHLPTDCRISETADRYPTIVFTRSEALEQRSQTAEQLRDRGIELVCVDCIEGKLSVRAILEELASRKHGSVFVEGGSRVITSFLAAGVVQRLVVIIAPIIIGEGIAAVSELGIRSLADAIQWRTERVRTIGRDVVWELYRDEQ
jgi:riboflavin-specific deaminase-like protein